MSEQPDPANPKTPIEEAVEHAIEVFVYAPIGLLFDSASLLPELVQKGKNQVATARMFGKFAVDQGQAEAGKLVNRFQDQAIDLLARIGGSTAPPPPVVAGEATAAVIAGDGAPPPVPAPAPVDPAAAAERAAGAAIDASTLAIPDYDGLSASHVVNRLAGLSDAELEAVRLYESANRGRKTILSKVAQLQAG